MKASSFLRTAKTGECDQKSIVVTQTQTHVDEQEISKQVLSLLELYVYNGEKSNTKIGVVGLLKEIADLVIGKSSISNLTPHIQYNLLQYVFNCMVTYLTQKNMSQRRQSVMLSMEPLAMRCVQYIYDAYTKDQDDKEMINVEDLHEESVLRKINVLKFPLERIQLAWDLAIEELIDLVRLGDRYLKMGLWQQAESAYQEGFQQLMILATSDINMVDGLARLVVLGYGHALFGQGKFIAASRAFRLGLHFFPSFPTLPFDPRNLYKSILSTTLSATQPLDRIADYNKTLSELEQQIQRLEQTVYPNNEQTKHIRTQSDPNDSEIRNLLLLKFAQAFEYYFIGKQEESRSIFEELLNSTKKNLNPVIDNDSNDSDILDTMDFSTEIEYFLKPAKFFDMILPRGCNANYLRIDMNDQSLKQLEVWTKRLLDAKKGVEIRDRKWRLKIYESCFICSEAVTYISKNGDLSRTDAVEFLQRIMNRYVLRHVYDEHMIEDAFLFFRAQDQLIEFAFKPILQEGYLLKKSSKWIKRYAVLYSKALAFFENGPGSRLLEIVQLDKKGQVLLGQLINKEQTTGIDGYIFNLTIGVDVTGGTASVLTFSTEKMEETRQMWIRAFQKIQHLKVQLLD